MIFRCSSMHDRWNGCLNRSFWTFYPIVRTVSYRATQKTDTLTQIYQKHTWQIVLHMYNLYVHKSFLDLDLFFYSFSFFSSLLFISLIVVCFIILRSIYLLSLNAFFSMLEVSLYNWDRYARDHFGLSVYVDGPTVNIRRFIHSFIKSVNLLIVVGCVIVFVFFFFEFIIIIHPHRLPAIQIKSTVYRIMSVTNLSNIFCINNNE